jgi:hypothetical protein
MLLVGKKFGRKLGREEFILLALSSFPLGRGQKTRKLLMGISNIPMFKYAQEIRPIFTSFRIDTSERFLDIPTS